MRKNYSVLNHTGLEDSLGELFKLVEVTQEGLNAAVIHELVSVLLMTLQVPQHLDKFRLGQSSANKAITEFFLAQFLVLFYFDVLFKQF